MNRLMMIIVTGFLAVMLSSCEDKSAPKPAEDMNNPVVKTHDNVDKSVKMHDDNVKKGMDTGEVKTESH